MADVHRNAQQDAAVRMATFVERGVAARNILFRPYVMVPGTGNAVANGVRYGRDACIAGVKLFVVL